MPIVDLDLTGIGVVPDGVHVAQVVGVEYQVKSGEKWNYDGTTTVTFEEWATYPADLRRLHYSLKTQHGMVWLDCYLKDTALPILKRFLKACGVNVSKGGFDPEEALGKEVVVTVESDENGSPRITKVEKP